MKPGATALWAALLVAAGLGGCGGDGDPFTAASSFESCGPFPEWSTSAYRLPYPEGAGYRVDQGNCSGFGHSGFWKHGYDFAMEIGTLVTAARAGSVVHVRDGADDGDRARTNLVTLQHDDGDVSVYSHLTKGLLVVPGQLVAAGDPLGRSGDTGNTGGLPHLHFSLHPCADLPGLPGPGSCPSIPVNFRNTDPNPEGPLPGRVWTAAPAGAS